MASPSIDVIIPTYNSQRTLEECLSRIRSQEYPGEIHIIIVDGGSSDKTIEVAKAFDCEIYIKAGMYGTGLNGAREFGTKKSNSPILWNIDSDNILVERRVASDLVAPLADDPTISISTPVTSIDPSASSFNNWMSLQESENVFRMTKSAKITKDYYVVEDMSYGLTNAAMIRRIDYQIAGGYDSDIRLLQRLRKKGLSKGAIVPTAHIFHNQVVNIRDYMVKWSRRISKFANMNEDDFKEYFVEYPVSVDGHSFLTRNLIKSLASYPANSFGKYLETRDPTWLWGLAYPLINLAVFARNPSKTMRVYSNLF